MSSHSTDRCCCTRTRVSRGSRPAIPMSRLKKFTNPNRRLFVVLGVGALAVAAGGGAIAGSSTLAGGHRVADPAAEVLARVGSPRLAGIDLSGSTARVTGNASGAGGEATRTLWYQTLAGAAYAQKVVADRLSRQAIDDSGAVVEQAEDAVAAGAPNAFAPATVSGADIARAVQARAAGIGVRVLSTHYIPLFGGTAEIVVQPLDEASFIASSSERIGALLGDLAQNQRPYLVTVVDRGQAPRLVVGYTPNVGGGTGQGIAWQAPGVHSTAIWGDPQTGVPLP